MRSFIRIIVNMIIGAILALTVLFILAVRMEHSRIASENSLSIVRRQYFTPAEQKRNIEAWPWIEDAPEPPGILPRINPLPPVYFRLAPANAAGEITDSETVRHLFKRTLLALETCPEPALRNDLRSLIFSGQVFLGFRRYPTAAGTYSLHEVYEKPTSLIVLNPDQITRLDDRTELFDLCLTAYHELSHYRTHLAGGDMAIRTGKLTAESCEERWQTEWTAYTEMCDLSRRWNYPREKNFCETRLNGPSFNQRLLWRLTSAASAEHPDSRLQCSFVWAKMAGHPNPELYR